MWSFNVFIGYSLKNYWTNSRTAVIWDTMMLMWCDYNAATEILDVFIVNAPEYMMNIKFHW